MSVEARARALFGEAPAPAQGVVHVCSAAWPRGADSGSGTAGRSSSDLRAIEVGPDAPKSDTDLFVLGLTRARVDAILITGAILRAEPTLRYDLPPDLAAWRAAPPPRLLVLTRGDVPHDHPVWESASPPTVFTTSDHAAALRAALPDRVGVVGVDDPSPQAAIAYLRDTGASSISIEAGPTVAAPLHAADAIDELVLSIYEAPLPEHRLAGRPFPSLAHLHQVAATLVDEPSGPWRFTRWIRG